MLVKCKWCQITFRDSQALQKHLKTDLKSHQYFCQKCEYTFKSFRALKGHFENDSRHDASDQLEMASNVRAYCIHCRRQFDTASQLNGHFAKTHPDGLHCDKCDLWFRYSTNLQQHIESPVHNKRNIPCPHCSEEFKTTSGVAHHMEYKCLKRVTEAVIKWDVDHQITDRKYTDRIRDADSGSDSYSSDGGVVTANDEGIQQVLEVLATRETWDADLRAFVCPVSHCERQFAKLNHLNQHLRSQIHRMDPSTFRCPKCSSRFSVVSALVQHLESGSCGLAGQHQVKLIYTGLHDAFKRLLKY
ncbi:hypothetical protein FRC16_009178 [Serendipita sp. 398]|nr:hypothetical protein FRC16_009178 [Serendipita sp. 398]